MFAIKLSYRIALFPYPLLFITLYTDCEKELKELAKNIIISVLLPIIDKAKHKYNAVDVPIEPTTTTHALEFDDSEPTVTVCCSLRFNKIEDIKRFVEYDIYSG